MTKKQSSAAFRKDDQRFRLTGDGALGGFKKGVMNGPEPVSKRGKRRDSISIDVSKTQRRLDLRRKDFDIMLATIGRGKQNFNSDAFTRPGSMKPCR